MIQQLRRILRTARTNQVPYHAAAITYYALISIVPVVVLAFIVLTAFGGEALGTSLIESISGLLTPSGYSLVQRILADTSGRSELTVFSALLLIWGVTRIFQGFDTAFSYITNTPVPQSPLKIAVRIIHGAAAIAIAVVLTGTFLYLTTYIPSLPFTTLLSPITGFFGLTIMFLPLYYVFSELPLQSTLPGALFAASGWTLAQLLFQHYITASPTTVYNLFGGILLVVTWLYLGNILILLGAVINTELYQTNK